MKVIRQVKSQQNQRKLAITTALDVAANMREPDSAVNLVKNLLTEGEQINLGRRLLIARMILEGKSQAEIRFQLGVSPNTFTRARKWLTKEIPEYGEAIKEHEKQKREQAKIAKIDSQNEKVAPFSYTDLKRRYPMHFLLFSVAEELFRQDQ